MDVHCVFHKLDPWQLPDDTEVSILTPVKGTGVKLKVEQTFKVQQHRQFTVCVWTPLFTGDSRWLVEWLEMNIILGAEYFYIYPLRFMGDAAKVLQYYEKMERVKILPWTMPNLTFHGARICHGNFQLAMIGDCHMRNINMTQYLLGEDFDEIITPYGNATTWLEMIKHSKCNEASAIIARHTLFANHPQSEIDALCAGYKPYFGPFSSITKNKTEQFLSIMCITKRMPTIFGVPARSKYI